MRSRRIQVRRYGIFRATSRRPNVSLELEQPRGDRQFSTRSRYSPRAAGARPSIGVMVLIIDDRQDEHGIEPVISVLAAAPDCTNSAANSAHSAPIPPGAELLTR